MGSDQAGKTNHVIRGLTLSHLISTQHLVRAGGLEIEFNYVTSDTINHGSVMSPQQKLWTQKLS